MGSELVKDALKMAFITRRPSKGVVFHSDRGAQYTSFDYACLAREMGVVLSVGMPGQCFDKAMASYCTPYPCSGVKSLSKRTSLLLTIAGVSQYGWVKE
jgi:hypothetical protein